MSNLMERRKEEISKTIDPGIEVDKRKRDIMGVFEILEDIIGRADLAEEELRKSIELLHNSQKQKYAEILKLLQEENEEKALALLRDSDGRAIHAKLAARNIESLMDDLVRQTEALRGIIKPEKDQ